jgi:hypothetical protein
MAYLDGTFGTIAAARALLPLRGNAGCRFMRLRRTCVACAACLSFWAPEAAAQQPARPTVPVRLTPPSPTDMPRFTLQEVGRASVVPPHSGLIVAIPLEGGAQLGVGRYRLRALMRPPTNLEPDRRSRAHGIAAVGLSIRF